MQKSSQSITTSTPVVQKTMNRGTLRLPFIHLEN